MARPKVAKALPKFGAIKKRGKLMHETKEWDRARRRKKKGK